MSRLFLSRLPIGDRGDSDLGIPEKNRATRRAKCIKDGRRTIVFED